MQRDVRKFGISDKRGRSTTNADPYLPHKGLKEPACCSDCHAVYFGKHWIVNPQAYADLSTRPETRHTLCPACRKETEQYAQGVVTLRGDYFWKHEEEISNILTNVGNRSAAKSPLQHIVSIDRQGDAVTIETSDEKLAEQLGRAVHKAHQGKLQIHWSDGHDLCRVVWERQA